MPLIAPHHVPGTTEYAFDRALRGLSPDAGPYVPSALWPDDCLVQWGGNGVVLSAKGNYETAFFEAFPRSPDTFIRGEGETISSAEADALRLWERISACPEHEYETRGYRNGAGFCRHCGMFASKVFSWPCRDCQVETNYYPVPHTEDHLCQTCFEETEEGQEHLALRARLRTME